MPWQRESPRETPGLLGPRGGINPEARRRPWHRSIVNPDRSMLNMRLLHNSPGVGIGVQPMRRRIADDVDDPNRSPQPARPQSGRGFITPAGHLDPHVRYSTPLPKPMWPQPDTLDITVYPRRRDVAPAQPPVQTPDPRTRRTRPQQALINENGAVTHNARARKPRRRGPDPNTGGQP